MIYIKWGTYWSEDPSKAPSIISQLLMVFLNMGSTGPENNKTPLFHKDDYSYQEKFQFYGLAISVICIPNIHLIFFYIYNNYFLIILLGFVIFS